MTKGRVRILAAGLASATALAAAGGATAATITKPANGQTVPISPSFSWTMGPNEVLPQLEVVPNPSYTDPNTVASCQPNSDTGTSCSVVPMDAGTYYAFVQTDDNDSGNSIFSPLVRFVVPPEIGFAPTNPWGKNPGPIPQTERDAGIPDKIGGKVYVSPFATIQVEGWLNDPGAKVTVTYTVKNGGKVLLRATHTRHVDRGEEDWSFGANGSEVLIFLHLPGAASGARLKCTIRLSGDGVSASRAVTIRNPPPGGRVKH